METEPSVTPRVDDFVASLRPFIFSMAGVRDERKRWIQFAEIIELELTIANRRVAELEKLLPPQP